MKRDNKEKAVALRYDPETDNAPVVTAKGQGELAQKIKELAKEYGVPIEEDKFLANYLMSLDLYEEVPTVLYPVIAEILAFIYRINNKYENKIRYGDEHP